MTLVKRILQFKPTLKRLVAAVVICSPVVALTNGLQRSGVVEVRAENPVASQPAVRIIHSLANDRCLRIESPGN